MTPLLSCPKSCTSIWLMEITAPARLLPLAGFSFQGQAHGSP